MWGQVEGKKAFRLPATQKAQLAAAHRVVPVIAGTSLEPGPASAVVHSNSEVHAVSAGRANGGDAYRPAEIGSCCSVNGMLAGLGDSSSYVSVPNPSGSFWQNFDGTLEMWIYPDSERNTYPYELVSKGDTSAQEFLLALQSSQLFLRINDNWAYNIGGDTIPEKQWTHVAVTWTGGGPYYVDFYVNGAHNGKTDTLNATWSHNADPLIIGAAAYHLWWREAFKGMIDEVRLWNPALPQATIAQNRFLCLGDGPLANDTSAITWANAYTGLLDSWTFNSGGSAYDDIGGQTGTFHGNANPYAQAAGEPIPYNLALYLPGSSTSYVRMPSNTQFDQSYDGSLEAWVKPATFANDPVIVTKGATVNQSFFWAIAFDSLQCFRIGTTLYYDTAKLKPNVWSHLAVTWTGGPNFTVNFYVNGKPTNVVTASGTWDFNTDYVYIGQSQSWTSELYTGYIDELRLWQRQLTASEILSHMFASGRALSSDADLLGCWNFDGNLLNFGHTSNINGSFNNGQANAARLSAYRYETVTGPPDGHYGSHSTVLNWYYGGTSGVWPDQFQVTAPFAPIHDNDTVHAAVSQLVVTNPTGTVGNVTLFLAIDHTWINDLVARVTAPNGQSRYLLDNTGDWNENALTFFDDAFGEDASSRTYFAPWAYLRPLTPFGNFGGSPVQGTWTLKVYDNAAYDSGMVKGWGLRFYNTLGVRDGQSPLPVKFDLAQNYPNPFNPSTTINFSIPREVEVRLVVYNVLGQEVETLVSETMKPGNHAVSFDAAKFASGTYFYRLMAGSYTATRKMLLLK